MIWHSPRKQAEAEKVQQEIDEAEKRLAEVQRRWPTVKDITHALIERRLENGFGEDLTVAWIPRGRNQHDE